jgi:uncharacterized membrane protein YcaP (DUF421 family)
MIISFVRAIILYFAVMIAIRIMGKRQIGDLQPFELVVTIMISDIASAPMQAIDVPLLQGIIPIFTLVIIEVCFSFFALKNKRLRRVLVGSPSILIRDGKINMQELEKLRLSYDDLMEELRLKDISSIDDVDLAIIETNGDVSLIPKSDKRPLTPEDVNIKPEQEKLPYMVVSDGNIIQENLKKSGLTKEKLYKLLKKRKQILKDVAVGTYSKQDGLVTKTKGKSKNKS